MPTIFRFSIQTKNRRFSEVWSFFCNDNEGCLYATRTSMKKWSKISFHKSRICHIKTFDEDSRPHGTKEFEWMYPEIMDESPVHAMRLIYDIERQTGNFPPDERIRIVFEEWTGSGSLYLDVFFSISEPPAKLQDNIIAKHCMDGKKWVYFTIESGPPQNELPRPISGMTFNMGPDTNKITYEKTRTLINTTSLYYSIPEAAGTIILTETATGKLHL